MYTSTMTDKRKTSVVKLDSRLVTKPSCKLHLDMTVNELSIILFQESIWT